MSDQGLQRALFLDRDGVLIEDNGYIGDIRDVVLLEKIIPSLQWAQEQGIPLFVVTNQSGVARGFYSLDDCHKVHAHIDLLLESFGVVINRWYICPHHPAGQGEYKKVCSCRKPAPGMLFQAANEFNLNLQLSLMLGDKISDCFNLEYLTTFLLPGKYSLDGHPDRAKIVTCDNLLSEVQGFFR